MAAGRDFPDYLNPLDTQLFWKDRGARMQCHNIAICLMTPREGGVAPLGEALRDRIR